MRVLLIHNRYRQQGGEDTVVDAERNMLLDYGVEVQFEVFTNEFTASTPMISKMDLFINSAWSRRSFARIQEVCRKFKPHIAHVHNFWMSASPSVHSACRQAGAATVQTVHNFRLLCLNAQFLRAGRICEDCLGKVPWRGVLHRCYRNSVAASSATAGMILLNRWSNTWERNVDAFIALSEHGREKLIAGGLPADRIHLKPNFTEREHPAAEPPSSSTTCLYVGRLSPEKGVDLLIRAWAICSKTVEGELVIAGDGPCRKDLEKLAAKLCSGGPPVRFTGALAHEAILSLIDRSRCVVLPSICYETGGMTLLEAAAASRPVVASDLGALPETVLDEKTGLLFRPGNVEQLSRCITRLCMNSPCADALGSQGRLLYLERFAKPANFGLLMDIYRIALQRRKRALPGVFASPSEANDSISSYCMPSL